MAQAGEYVFLRAAVTKKRCELLMLVERPAVTLGKLAALLAERRTVPETIRLQAVRPGHAEVFLCCHIDRDGYDDAVRGISLLDGVVDLQVL